MRLILPTFLALALLELPAVAAPTDWLVDPSSFKASVRDVPARKELVLSNGLARRVIRLAPAAATVAIEDLTTGEHLLRAVGPEAADRARRQAVPHRGSDRAAGEELPQGRVAQHVEAGTRCLPIRLLVGGTDRGPARLEEASRMALARPAVAAPRPPRPHESRPSQTGPARGRGPLRDLRRIAALLEVARRPQHDGEARPRVGIHGRGNPAGRAGVGGG